MSLEGAIMARKQRKDGKGLNLNRVVVGRQRHHRMDLRLALGSITEAESQAYVLGIFRDVRPAGAASALDVRMNGAISEFTARRMYSGNVGEIFMMPSGRHRLPADVILFTGLGAVEVFDEGVQQLVAENAIRTLVRFRIHDFATVLIGAGSGKNVKSSVRNLMTGFVRGLRDADPECHFRSITFCEIDPKRYEEIKLTLYELSRTSLFEDIEVTFFETELPEPPKVEQLRLKRRSPEPAYLIVNQQVMPGSKVEFHSSLLTSGGKATVVAGTKVVERDTLDKHLRFIETSQFGFKSLQRFGDQLAKMILNRNPAKALGKMKSHHVVVVHDAGASRIPWETIHLGKWSPAAGAGLLRKYVAEDLSIAKWLEQRRYGPMLDLLLVVNPTGDLPGAEAEGERIHDLFGGYSKVNITELRGAEAGKEALMQAFASGDYDAVHYAGHAFFDEKNPAESGIICHGHEVLRGADLSGVATLPALVFFNACEAARVRRGRDRRRTNLAVSKRVERTVGLAEAFLRGGVANYVGTYWPVGDAPAKRFAETFYTKLLEGASIGYALQDGRSELRSMKSVDWADYVHYGSFDFVLKTPE
jgi:hypothetical protein